MRAHDLGQKRHVDGILIDGIKLRKDSLQQRPQHVGRQPRNPIDVPQTLRQRRLADPGRASDPAGRVRAA